jgi:hypothetical protein
MYCGLPVGWYSTAGLKSLTINVEEVIWYHEKDRLE